MADFTSATRLTGLSSGIDTDSYVKQLMSAASTRYNSYQRNLQKLQWKQTAYRDTASKIQSFQGKWLDLTSSTSMRRQSSFTSKYTSSITKADGNATSTVAISGIKGNGNHTVTVKETASTAKLQSSSSVSGTLSNASGASSFTFNYDGTSADVTVAQGLTGEAAAQSVRDQLAAANITGLNVTVDSNNKMSITSSVAGHAMSVQPAAKHTQASDMYTVNYDGRTTKFEVQTRADGNLSVIYGSTTLDTNTTDAAAALDQAFSSFYGTVTTMDDDGNESQVRAVTASTDEDGNVTVSTGTGRQYALQASSEASSVTGDSDIKTIHYGEEGNEQTLDFKLTANDDGSYNLDLYSDVNTSQSYATKEDAQAALNEALKNKFGTVKDQNLDGTYDDSSEKAAVTATVADDGTVSVESASVNKRIIADVGHNSEISKAELTRNISDSNFETIKSDSKVSKSDYISSVIGDFQGTKSISINGASVTIDADTTISDFINSVNNSDAGVKMSYNAVSGAFTLETKETGSAQKIEFNDQATKDLFSSLGFDTSTVARGTDASLIVDGVETVSATNKLAFDEFTADISYATKDTELTLKTSKDTQAIYDMLKSFVDEYNELISGITATTKENRTQGPKGYYEPLTDSDKESMKEDDIKKWETEAKKGLLHSDKLLTGFMSSARSAIYSAKATNSKGSSIGIYNIGITTSSDMSKAGQLTIDESKLKAAIEDDPDAVAAIINDVADKLNNVVKNYTGTNGLISNKAGIEGTSTEFNNSLYSEINRVKDKISKENTRLQAKESKYYEMFANMETFINKNNTNLDSLYSYFS